MFLKCSSHSYFSGSSPIAAFLFKIAKVCMYKTGGFPNMPENSNFNSVIKVRRLVNGPTHSFEIFRIYLQKS